MFSRPWAFWRRTQYIVGVCIFFALIGTGMYYGFLYESATCFDNSQNADERGVDCGGACTRICPFDTLPPKVLWAKSFRVTQGQYNAVAYIENKNITAGTPELKYKFSLYDGDGLITERSGTTVMPPDSVYPIFEGRIETGSRVPTQTFIELEDAELWLPADKGRKQFEVKARQLKGADSRPRLTAEIYNNELIEANDVEIVATIFDSRGNALTSSRTVVEQFPSRSTQDVIFTWPEPIARTLRSCDVPTDVVVAIDLSGSMNDDGGNPPQPVTAVLEAASAFVQRLRNGDQGSVVTYATDASVVEQLTPNVTAVRGIVKNLSIAAADEKGSTNTGDALIRAREELGSARHNLDARKVLVLLTDGLANAPGDDPEEYAVDAALKLKQGGVDVFTIGLGTKVNEEFLKLIASDGQHYFSAPTTGTLGRIYESITAAICEDGAAVIEIIHKTETNFKSLGG